MSPKSSVSDFSWIVTLHALGYIGNAEELQRHSFQTLQIQLFNERQSKFKQYFFQLNSYGGCYLPHDALYYHHQVPFICTQVYFRCVAFVYY